MKTIARSAAAVGALLALLAVGPADARKAKDILQYIPADTPYVVAFTKPLPDDLLDKMEPAMDETLAAYRKMMEFMIEGARKGMAEEEGGAEEAARFEDLMREIMGLLSTQGLKDAGMGRDALFALYGDGLLPVIRFALSDGEKFQATIARFEDKAGIELQVGELDGVPYRYQDFDGKARLIIATPKDDAIVTLVPAAYDDERLAQTLGIKKPKNSLYRSKELKRIAREYDFTDHITSFIDVERLAQSFFGDPSGLNAELFAVTKYDSSRLDATCREEFSEIAAIAPRIVLGYTEVSDERLDVLMVVELREDLAQGLATLPAAVPGLGADLGGLFTFGISMDLMALRNFYESRLDAMEADPYECGALAELQASTVKGREALMQPVPPVVYSFRGFLANVTDITGLDLASQKPPESIDGSLLIAMENAQDLVNMAALMSPQVAALNLLPDGEARLIDLPELAELPGQLFAALSGDGLSMALGASGAEKAQAMLQGDVDQPMPLMTFSMDANYYYEFVGEAVMQADDPEEGEPTPQELKEAIRDIMVASGSVYDRMTTNLHLTERGIELGTSITLAD
jgi:hypothetical protein